MNTSSIRKLEPAGEPMVNDPLVIMLASGPEDGGKRATLAYSAACTAAGMDTPTRIFLVGDGTHRDYEGHTDGCHMDGFPPLQELVELLRQFRGEE
ncbi:MAG: hypothetical protein PVI50_05535 [Gammaproteobacteria bacterium]|jgi:predicted peroxiredoxin